MIRTPTSATVTPGSEPTQLPQVFETEQNTLPDDTNVSSCSDSSVNHHGNYSDSVLSVRSIHDSKQCTKQAELAEWAVTHNLTHSSVSDLLKLLNKWLPFDAFPIDARTLLKTPRKVKVLNVEGGQFSYFGLQEQMISGLESSFHACALSSNEITLHLKIGIDGVPVSKSNNSQFWPILASVCGEINLPVFIVGLFLGESKPQSITEYLKELINEVEFLEQNGLIFSSKRFPVKLKCIVADAPARSFLKCTKNHNAFYGCERCACKGKWDRKVLFENGSYPLYSDKTFRDRVYSKHHNGTSPFERLPIDMIHHFPIDYMHLCCLGVTRKLLYLWTEIKPHKLRNSDIQSISNRLVLFGKLMPKCFNRKVRSLKDLHHFKATEFRSFMLYIGGPALLTVLDKKRFKHFLLFHTAMYILCSDSAYKSEWVSFAGNLLRKFVIQAEKIYGEGVLTYNLHTLQHLHLDVEIHGKLDNFSAFEFENFMQTMKKMVRGNNFKLEQVAKRLSEIGNFGHKSNCSKQFTVSTKSSENCYILKDGRVALIKQINGDSITIISPTKTGNVKSYPCDSTLFGIHRCSNFTIESVISASQLYKQCILLPYSNGSVCIPLLH